MMKWLCFIFLFFTFSIFANERDKNKLIESIFIEKAWTHFNKLTQEFGSPENGAGFRAITPGSDEDKEIVDYILKECKNLGLNPAEEFFNVKTYRYELPEIKVGKKKIRAISLFGGMGIWGFNAKKPYSLGNDRKRKKLESILINVGRGTTGELEKSGDIKGKFLLVERDDKLWPTIQIIEAEKRGASGVILFSKEDSFVQTPLDSTIPVYALSSGEASRVQHELSLGRNKIEISGRADIDTDKTSNIVLYRRGNLFPDESIIIGINRDRWFREAHGSSSGMSALLELLRVFSKSTFKNNRTIIFAFWGASRSGGNFPYWHNGPYDFISKHPEIMNKLVAFIDLSGVGGTDYTGKLSVSPEMADFLSEILKKVNLDQVYSLARGHSPLDIAYLFGELSGGSSIKILRSNGGLRLDARSINNSKFVSKENLKRDIELIIQLVFEFDKIDMLPFKYSEIVNEHIKEFEDDYERMSGEIVIPDIVNPLKELLLFAMDLEKKQSEILEIRKTDKIDPIKKIEQDSKFNSIQFDFRRALLPYLFALSDFPGFARTPRLRQYRMDLLSLKGAEFALRVNDPLAAKKSFEEISSLLWGQNYSVATFDEMVRILNSANKWTRKQLRYYPSSKIYDLWMELSKKEFADDFDFTNILESLQNISIQFEKKVLDDATLVADNFTRTHTILRNKLSEFK